MTNCPIKENTAPALTYLQSYMVTKISDVNPSKHTAFIWYIVGIYLYFNEYVSKSNMLEAKTADNIQTVHF